MSDECQWTTAQMVKDHPELSTRPLAVAQLLSNRRLRRHMTRIMSDLFGVATRLARSAPVTSTIWFWPS